MEITLFSTGCPKCKVLKSKMDQKGISYTLIEDSKEVVAIGKANRIMSAPILKVDEKVMDFSSANNWLNENNIETNCEEVCKF